MRYPKVGGKSANARAVSFETSVREAIEATPCPPAPWLKALLGRHLRRQGEHDAFGEIDAAASLPGGQVHLLVSCKSYPFTEAYERGDFGEVRNVSSRLTKDLDEAIDFALTLREERTGANYAIPDDAVLAPIVVTPRHMYCDADIAERRWLDDEWGPRLLGGVAGLVAFLNQYRDAGPAPSGKSDD